MKKNLFCAAFTAFIMIVLTKSAYPQWVQTNWPTSSSFFNLYTNQDVVFARTWDSLNGGRLFFTGDNGESWTQFSSADSDIDILSIVMLNNNILVGTWNGFYRCTPDNIYWEPFEPAGIPADTAIWSIAMIDNTLFAGTGGNIYESSIDDVNNWLEASTGIPANARITSILANGNAIFAGSDSKGVFIAANGEKNWTAINSGLTDTHISQLASMGGKLFAVTLKDGVFISDSNGVNWVSDANAASWKADNSGLRNINCLLAADNLLFAGTDSNGVYLSHDSGLSWISVNSGMPANTRVWSLAASSDNIFAGTSEGIWRINPADIHSYTITADASEGGTISPFGTVIVSEGSSQEFKITSLPGFAVSDVTVDGNSVGAVSTYTFTNITENHTVSAIFETAPYIITASAGAGGLISPAGAVEVWAGLSQTFTITPSAGYDISSVLIDGVSVGAVTSFTFSSVNSNHTIAASFSTLTRYQINCGGGASSPYTADQYYSGGSTYSASSNITTTDVTNPAPQAVYQTERNGTMTYTFPDLVSGASYRVRLHFSENTWSKTGVRKFNVTINGTSVLSNYDIYAETGARYKAVVKEFTTIANTSGQIVIEFVNVAYRAKIGGIEIIRQ
ncbi:MAG: hypothetical protein JW787_00385 [Sedimentisphaerales bacterium]|nr:hypothetical protein [Sedimentisphaerales bacterium]